MNWKSQYCLDAELSKIIYRFDTNLIKTVMTFLQKTKIKSVG